MKPNYTKVYQIGNIFKTISNKKKLLDMENMEEKHLVPELLSIKRYYHSQKKG